MINEKKWKSLYQDFSKADISDAFLGGIIFATILYLPILVLLIEMVTVYMYRLIFLSIIIIISLFAYVFIVHYFWKKSLTLKNKDYKTNISYLFLKNTIIVNAIIFVLGILFIVLLIPRLWV